MPKRRTPQELQAHHEALAAKHAFAARVAADPILRQAIKLRYIVPDLNRSDELTDVERALITALDAYIGDDAP